VELVTASGTCHLRKNDAVNKKLRYTSASEKVFARFSGHFLRALVRLKSVFSNGQDVKYDLDINPHPHLFHGINSHEHSAHRDKRVNKTVTWK